MANSWLEDQNKFFFLRWNLSFGETLGQVFFSCRRLRWKSGKMWISSHSSLCASLWTFLYDPHIFLVHSEILHIAWPAALITQGNKQPVWRHILWFDERKTANGSEQSQRKETLHSCHRGCKPELELNDSCLVSDWHWQARSVMQCFACVVGADNKTKLRLGGRTVDNVVDLAMTKTKINSLKLQSTHKRKICSKKGPEFYVH